MNGIVVDASIVVEYLLGTATGLRARESMVDSELAAPEILDAEVLSVLRKWVLQGMVGLRRAEAAMDVLRRWDIERISHRYLIPLAWQYRNNVTAYDALYVAAARSTGLPLLTTDGPLARAPRLDVEVRYIARA